MQLHFVNQGTSHNPLVLLHAFPVSHEMWQHQIDALSEYIEVYAVDLPGFGASPTLRDDASMKAYVSSILTFMDEQGIEKAVFGGCSMGGYIIFELWRQARKRVAGMILCDTRAEADTDATKEARLQTIENVRAEGLGQLADGMIAKVLGETTLRTKPELTAAVKQSILKCSPVGVIHALQAMASRLDSTEDLSSIKVPTLILAGSEDKVTPISAAQRMAEGIPNSTVVEIAQAGHFAPLEQPDAVNSAMIDFLGQFK